METASAFLFGDFELDLKAEVLKRSGVRVKLAGHPLRLLALLVERAGELVTREDIRNALWASDTVVEFDHSVNQYIRQVRTALGDSRETPTYIETAPRRGYRFVAEVRVFKGATSPRAALDLTTEPASEAPSSPQALLEEPPPLGRTPAAPADSAPPATAVKRRAVRNSVLAASCLLLVIAAALLTGWVPPGRYGNTGAHVLADEPHSRTHRSPVPAAHEAYLKGKYFFRLTTREGYKKSCDYFEQALRADPAYPLGYAGMAECYLASVSANLMPIEEANVKARAMARKAIELDDSVADGHGALGLVMLNYEWNWPAAYAELTKAYELDPNGVDTHLRLALYYRVVGRLEDAIREYELARALDPVSEKGYYALGTFYVDAGRYQDAQSTLQKGLEINPNSPYMHFSLFVAYDRLKLFAQAMPELQQYMSTQVAPELADQVAREYHEHGYERAKRLYLERMVASFLEKRLPALQIAYEYALLGDVGRTLDYLEQAYRERSNSLNRLKINSNFDFLRSEPRFQRLLEQIGLTDAQLGSRAAN